MKTISLKIPVIFIKQGKQYLAYSPAFDISTSGNTLKHAKQQFDELMELFFEGLQELGTLEQTLKEAGYSKSKRSWQPSHTISHSIERIAIPA